MRDENLATRTNFITSPSFLGPFMNRSSVYRLPSLKIRTSPGSRSPIVDFVVAALSLAEFVLPAGVLVFSWSFIGMPYCP